MTTSRVISGIGGMHTTLLNASLAASSLNASTALDSVVELQGGYLQPGNSIPSNKKVVGLAGELLSVDEATGLEPTFGKSGA